jgi:hypothetical protein
MSEKIIHYGSFDRGIAVVLAPDLPALYFGTTPVPFDNDKVYIASLDMEKEIDVRRRDALEQSKPFRQGKIRYIPSQAELLDMAKQKKEKEECATVKKDLESGIYTIELEKLNHEQLKQLADRIGAYRNTSKGENSSPLALRNAIAGTLGIQAPHTPPVVSKVEEKAPILPDVSDVMETPKPPKRGQKKKG